MWSVCCWGLPGNAMAQTDTIQQKAAVPVIKVRLPQHWRLGIQNGVSYQWANTGPAQQKLIDAGANADDVDDYFNQSRRGYHFSADIHRIFSDVWGIGIRYSIMANVAEQFLRFDMGDGLNLLNTNIMNREYVNFVGASLFIQQRFTKAKALCLSSSIALGYVHYRNELETDFNNEFFKSSELATGNSFGGSWDISLEYFPNPMLSVVVGAGCFLARFDRLSVNSGLAKSTIDLSGDDRKNVSRLDFFIGLRVYL